MAKAETKKKVTRVTLELSADEADTLAALLGNIGGSPLTSPRKHVNSISTALKYAGFHFTTSKASKLLSGNIFRNYSAAEVF